MSICSGDDNKYHRCWWNDVCTFKVEEEEDQAGAAPRGERERGRGGWESCTSFVICDNNPDRASLLSLSLLSLSVLSLSSRLTSLHLSICLCFRSLLLCYIHSSSSLSSSILSMLLTWKTAACRELIKQKRRRKQMICRGIRGETAHICISRWVRWLDRSSIMDLSFMAAQVRRLSSCLFCLNFNLPGKSMGVAELQVI